MVSPGIESDPTTDVRMSYGCTPETVNLFTQIEVLSY